MLGDSDRVPRLLMCTHANEHLFCNLHCVVVVVFLIDGGDICSILYVVCVCVCARPIYIIFIVVCNFHSHFTLCKIAMGFKAS